MTRGHSAVFGIYNSRFEVELAVDQLKTADFRNSDISVLMPEKGNTETFAHIKETKAPEGAAAGASIASLAGCDAHRE